VTGQAASGGKTHTGYRYRMIWRDFRLTARVTLRRWFPSLLYFSDTLAQRALLTASLQNSYVHAPRASDAGHRVVRAPRCGGDVS